MLKQETGEGRKQYRSLPSAPTGVEKKGNYQLNENPIKKVTEIANKSY